MFKYNDFTRTGHGVPNGIKRNKIMTEIQQKNAIVTITYRVFTTNTHNGDAIECDERGALYSQNTGFSGFLREDDARQVLNEINEKYPPFDPKDADQEYQKYHNENWIRKETYIVLLDDDNEEEDTVLITEVLK